MPTKPNLSSSQIQPALTLNSCQQHDINKRQTIIAELCSNAPNNVVRDCIRLYDPLKPSSQVKKSLNQCLKETLKETLTYLNKKPSETSNKPAILHNLICRIQNLFPNTCQICNEKYCIRRTDKTFLACKVCGQEVHKECFVNLFPDGTPNYNPYNVPGSTISEELVSLKLFPKKKRTQPIKHKTFHQPLGHQHQQSVNKIFHNQLLQNPMSQ